MLWKKKTYSVKMLGRSTVLYREGTRKVSLFSEFLVGQPYELAIYLSRVSCWDSPDDHTLLSEPERERIKGRVNEKLRGKIDWA